MRILLDVLLVLVGFASAQSSAPASSPTSAPTSAPTVSTFSSSVPRTSTFSSRGTTFLSTFFAPTTVTSTISPSTTATSSSSSSSPSSTLPPPVHLDNVLDPGFGVLGALLILTGLPCAFLGHKNRWSSYFLAGFYSFSLICLSLILKFGVLPAINPPSRSLRGLFVLASIIAGIGGGAISILFWGQAKYFVGALGGFALAIWIQCFRNGGLIRAIGYRWIFYIASTVVGFILCTIPKIHYHVLLASTAMVGATAFMLGVDCFTLVSLKEFYVYNLGFSTLFPKFISMHFPVTQTMQIEIGLIAATALAGTAIQLRILAVLQIKLRQIKAEQKRRNEAIEARAAERFAEVEKDLERWEKEHGRGGSRQALLKPSGDDPGSPGAFSNEDSTLGKPMRPYSGLSDLGSPSPLDEKSADNRQGHGPLPLLNLGDDLVQGLSDEAKTPSKKADDQGNQKPVLKERTSWLVDFEDIRKSIDWLRRETPTPSEGNRSRKVSFASGGRTPSQHTAEILSGPPHQERPRVRSMGIFPEFTTSPEPVRGRANSTPLRDEEWDKYVQERKLFTPPSGVSAPIPTSERPRSSLGLIPIPESVRQAADERRHRESTFELTGLTSETGPGEVTTTGQPNAQAESSTSAHQRSQSTGHIPVQILPPQRPQKVEERTSPVRTRTYEELVERHKRKMSDLQRPLTQAEREQAELHAVKSRWERSQRLEKRDVEKRQAENQKRASVTLKDKIVSRPSRRPDGPSVERRHQGLTSDQLATVPGSSSKRSSTAKVLEWHQHQQGELAADLAGASSPPAGVKRQSRHVNPDASSRMIPFPQSTSRPTK